MKMFRISNSPLNQGFHLASHAKEAGKKLFYLPLMPYQREKGRGRGLKKLKVSTVLNEYPKWAGANACTAWAGADACTAWAGADACTATCVLTVKEWREAHRQALGARPLLVLVLLHSHT